VLGRIVSILDSELGLSKQFGNSEFYYFCPFCHHHKAKLAVNIDKRMWQCWKCGTRGGSLVILLRRMKARRESIHELKTLLDEYEPKVAAHVPTTILSLPVEYTPLYDPPKTLESRHALTYLLSRGITRGDVLCHHIGFCPSGEYGGYIIIPSYDGTGVLNYFTGRSYHANVSWAHKTPSISKNIIGFESHINWQYPIVLVEGSFDAMAVKRNAIPLFGKIPSRKLQEKIIAEGVTDVYLALDRDALKESLTMAERFMKQGIAVHLVEINDKDPSKIGFVQMQHLIRTAQTISLYDLVKLRLSLI
jgi:CHC2-type zinc finger protein